MITVYIGQPHRHDEDCEPDCEPFNFMHFPIKSYSDHPLLASDTGVKMLAICRELRAEYLLANPKVHPWRGHSIYYNPDTTIIYIRDWDNLRGATGRALLQCIKNGLQLPWVTDIKLLAMDIYSLAGWYPGENNTGFGQDGDFSSLPIFKNLRQMIVTPAEQDLNFGAGALSSGRHQRLQI